MTAPAKFLFDHDFAAPAAVKTAIPLAVHEANLMEADASAYQRGFAAARAEIVAEAEQRSAAALEGIAARLEDVMRGLSGVEARLETEAVDVAVAVARKLCNELISGEPLAEITALVSDCFSHLVSTPHLVVRINDSLYEAAREKIERQAAQSGFEGRLVILAEPDIATGDCRIEWADGGVVLERAAIEAKINELVGRYMASRDQAGRP